MFSNLIKWTEARKAFSFAVFKWERIFVHEDKWKLSKLDVYIHLRYKYSFSIIIIISRAFIWTFIKQMYANKKIQISFLDICKQCTNLLINSPENEISIVHAKLLKLQNYGLSL